MGTSGDHDTWARPYVDQHVGTPAQQPVPEPRVAVHEGAAAPGAYARATTEPVAP